MRPDEGMANINYQKYAWRLNVYNKYLEVNRATTGILKKLFPDWLVGKEVGYKQLPPNLTAKETFKCIEKMAIVPFFDQDAVLILLESSCSVKYTSSPKGCTVLFQMLEHIQH